MVFVPGRGGKVAVCWEGDGCVVGGGSGAAGGVEYPEGYDTSVRDARCPDDSERMGGVSPVFE